MRLVLYVLVVLSLTPLFLPEDADARRHEDVCWFNPDLTLCGLQTNLGKILDPFNVIFPGFGTLMLWGPLVFGLWFVTKSPQIAGIIGILIVSTMPATTTLNPQAVGIGLTLFAMSLGIALIQIFQRIKATN